MIIGDKTEEQAQAELDQMNKDLGFVDDSHEIIYGKKKTEDNEEDDSEEEKPETKSKVDESEEDDLDDSKQKGVPYKVHNELRSQLREEREAKARIEAQLEEIQNSRKTAVDEDVIKKAAIELMGENADPDQIASTEIQLKKIVELTAGNNVALQKELAELKAKVEADEDAKNFNREWASYEDDLRKQYPGVSNQQLAEAQKVMDELAHSENFSDKELDYIAYKNKDIFDQICKPKKSKTFETRDTYVPREEESDEPTANAPIDKLLKQHEKLQKQARIEDNETGWNVMKDGKHF